MKHVQSSLAMRSSTGLATLSVCDPACGAGQFLVTWFEELLSAEVGDS